MGYLKAVLNDNRDSEIKNLKILVVAGKELKKNVSKYEKELRKYNIKVSSKDIIKKIVTKKIDPIEKIKKPKIKKAKISKIDTNKYEYSIKSVYTKNNSVVINFRTNISRDFVKFF